MWVLHRWPALKASGTPEMTLRVLVPPRQELVVTCADPVVGTGQIRWKSPLPCLGLNAVGRHFNGRRDCTVGCQNYPRGTKTNKVAIALTVKQVPERLRMPSWQSQEVHEIFG